MKWRERRGTHGGDHHGAVTVSELTLAIKGHIERRFNQLAVRGEVLSVRQVSSGHLYLLLKDAGAQLPCVVWRSTLQRLPLRVREGMSVIAFGDVQVYPPHGRYQMVLHRIIEAGDGDLLARLQELKQQLAAEGLFAAERKRPLPLLPRRIGVVTAETGAAAADIISTIRKRFPADILLCPVRVQGEGAARAISWGLRTVAAVPGVDVIIVGRGGGSAEDLWAFNEEAVVRAIAASPVPVISAVGHEIDQPLSDLVADVRAATPTAAGEMVIPQMVDLRYTLAQHQRRLAQQLSRRSQHARGRLAELRARLGDPRRHVADAQQRLDALNMRLATALQRRLATGRQRQASFAGRLRNLHPGAVLTGARQRLGDRRARLHQLIATLVADKRRRLGVARYTLTVLSPAASLDRGYAIVRDSERGVLRSAADVSEGASLEVLLRRGALDVTVDSRRGRHAFESEEKP